MDIAIWMACGITILVSSVFARRSLRAMRVGRVAAGVLMLVGGAAVNATYLWFGLRDYAAFADAAHFDWVTDAWHAVVAPNQALFINLLIAGEAAMGLLILSGGRRAQLGLAATIAFHALLCLFGWIPAVWALAMIPSLSLLLLAERRAAAAAAAPPAAPAPAEPVR